jgi:Amt family ammonium transporter
MVGMLLTGVFATTAVNEAGNNGWFYGNPGLFFTQLKGMAIVVAFSFTVSYAIFKFINFILPLRVSSAEEEAGLDSSQHDEKYVQGTLLVHNNGKLEEKSIESEKK